MLWRVPALAVPMDNDNGDVPINTYKKNFKGSISFMSVDKNTGNMKIAFQLRVPPVDFDLSHGGKGKSMTGFSFPATIRNRPTLYWK